MGEPSFRVKYCNVSRSEDLNQTHFHLAGVHRYLISTNTGSQKVLRTCLVLVCLSDGIMRRENIHGSDCWIGCMDCTLSNIV